MCTDGMGENQGNYEYLLVMWRLNICVCMSSCEMPSVNKRRYRRETVQVASTGCKNFIGSAK